MQIIANKKEYTFNESALLVSKTDLSGKITYANREFIDIVGFSESELIGSPHNIVRHPDMPKVIFKLMWDALKSEGEIHAYVKNITKDGGFYWVLANVTPSYNVNGKVVGFHSARRKPAKKALSIIEPLYKKMLDAESAGGIEASRAILNNLLKENGVEYEEFILSI